VAVKLKGHEIFTDVFLHSDVSICTYHLYHKGLTYAALEINCSA